MTFRPITGFLPCALVAVIAVQQPAWAETAGFLPYRDPQAVDRGREVYADYCASCHGTQLEGEDDWRDRDADGYLPAPPHDQSGHTWHHADSQLFAITKHGIEALVGNGYKSRMNGFADILTDQDIRAVLAFIKSTWPEPVIARHNDINAMAAGN